MKHIERSGCHAIEARSSLPASPLSQGQEVKEGRWDEPKLQCN